MTEHTKGHTLNEVSKLTFRVFSVTCVPCAGGSITTNSVQDKAVASLTGHSWGSQLSPTSRAIGVVPFVGAMGWACVRDEEIFSSSDSSPKERGPLELE